jgi:hypothetical protein
MTRGEELKTFDQHMAINTWRPNFSSSYREPAKPMLMTHEFACDDHVGGHVDD